MKGGCQKDHGEEKDRKADPEEEKGLCGQERGIVTDQNEEGDKGSEEINEICFLTGEETADPEPEEARDEDGVGVIAHQLDAARNPPDAGHFHEKSEEADPEKA